MRMLRPILASATVATLMATALTLGRPASSQSADFTLHEWGTFTSVSGSDGVLLPGLEVEEEELPYFVHAHEAMGGNAVGKGWLRPLHNVTIKMETPVVYFYAEDGFKAHVDVRFRGGSISQWFPQRSSGETPPGYRTVETENGGITFTGGDIDFAQGYDGAIAWDVEVLPPGDQRPSLYFNGDETLTWTYPRQTDANVLQAADGTREKYLFYRGLGNFELPVRFTMQGDTLLRIENRSDFRIPQLIVFDHSHPPEAMVRHHLVGALDGGEVREVDLAHLSLQAATSAQPAAPWLDLVYETMAGALVEAGLFRKEADAMVQTWWRSYFQMPGLRVFWIVPTEFTDDVLPLEVDPAPARRVRVLVGRSEILSPAFERRLGDDFGHADNPWEGDRFFKAYEARLAMLEGQATE